MNGRNQSVHTLCVQSLALMAVCAWVPSRSNPARELTGADATTDQTGLPVLPPARLKVQTLHMDQNAVQLRSALNSLRALNQLSSLSLIERQTEAAISHCSPGRIDDIDEGLRRILQEFLKIRAAIYQDRDQMSALRLRAYFLLKYAEVANVQEFLPVALEVLSTAKTPYEFVVSAHCISKAGAAGRDAEPWLARALEPFSQNASVSLSLSDAIPNAKRITVRDSATTALHSLRSSATPTPLAGRRRSCCAPMQGTARIEEWKPADRSTLAATKLRVQTQHGREVQLSSLFDRPVFLTFVYARCENESKCSRTCSQIADLQAQIRRTECDQMRIVVMTFEPAGDSIFDLIRFARDRGIDDQAEIVLCRPTCHADFQEFLAELKVPVNYIGTWVGIHGVSGYVLDSDGRLASSHTGPPWDPAMVFNQLMDLRREDLQH